MAIDLLYFLEQQASHIFATKSVSLL